MHVKLHLNSREGRRMCDPAVSGSLAIDGVEISEHVGANITLDYDGEIPKIHLTLLPDIVEVTGDIEVVLERIGGASFSDEAMRDAVDRIMGGAPVELVLKDLRRDAR